MERRARLLFVGLLVGFGAAAYFPVLRAKSLNVLGGFAVPLLMWAPGISAIIASAVCFRSLRPCGFGVHRRTWTWLLVGIAVPVVYTALIYLPLSAAGIVKLGGPQLTANFLLIGFGQSLLFSTGEEIGWRGFFAPLMTKRLGFLGGNLAIGGIWAAYHFPAILFAGYGNSASPLFGLAMFTVTVTGLSLFLGWSRLASESLWPAAALHATHNLIFLHLFDPMERTSPAAAWLIGEQGLLLCLVMIGLAVAAVVRSSKARSSDSTTAEVGISELASRLP